LKQKIARFETGYKVLFFFGLRFNQIPNEIDDKSLIINEDIAEIISSIV